MQFFKLYLRLKVFLRECQFFHSLGFANPTLWKNQFHLSIYFVVVLFFFLTACQKRKSTAEEMLDRRIDSLKRKTAEIKAERLDIIYTILHQKGLFNGNVLVVENGKTLLRKAYGVANFEKNTPLTLENSFRLGAISQTFTAAAVMLLVEKKQLKLDDKLVKFFPKIYYPEINIQHLLAHTSGLPDYLNYFTSNNDDVFTYANNQDVLTWLNDSAPELGFPPGRKWEFSNTNYVLLAKIIELVSKEKLEDFFAKYFFKPLNLKNTSLLKFGSKGLLPNQVIAYRMDRKEPYYDNFLNFIYGADGFYSSIDDLYQWEQSFYTTKIFSEKFLQNYFTPISQSQTFVKGWYINREMNYQKTAGSWLGYKACIWRMPQEQNSIIILTNHSCPVFEDLGQMTYNVLYNRAYKIPQ
jgi:CubicO group peptidase (beta-lactamase class C family)